MTCAKCHQPIERRFVGSVEVYGHVTRRAPADHHIARPTREAAKH